MGWGQMWAAFREMRDSLRDANPRNDRSKELDAAMDLESRIYGDASPVLSKGA